MPRSPSQPAQRHPDGLSEVTSFGCVHRASRAPSPQRCTRRTWTSRAFAVFAVIMRNSGKPAKATPCRKIHRKLRTPSSSTKKASALFVPLRCSIGENKPPRPETREDGNAQEQRAQRPFRHHCGKRRGMALLEDRYIRWMPNHRERLGKVRKSNQDQARADAMHRVGERR